MENVEFWAGGNKFVLGTHNINEQVFTGGSNIFSGVIETDSPNRPSEKIKKRNEETFEIWWIFREIRIV